MDVDEEQILFGQNLVNQFMAKDRKNLRYLNLAVAIIGFLTYLWSMSETEDNPYNYVLGPLIFVLFGGVIIYFTWYWKLGPGGLYLDSLDAMKNVGKADPGNYWDVLDKELSLAIRNDQWNDVLRLANIVRSRRSELEHSSNSLLLFGADEIIPLCMFNLGRYSEAKAAYESRIADLAAKGMDFSGAKTMLDECITKLSDIHQHVNQSTSHLSHPPTSQFPSHSSPPPPVLSSNQPVSMASPPIPSTKVCPYCQTQNPVTRTQCNVCLIDI